MINEIATAGRQTDFPKFISEIVRISLKRKTMNRRSIEVLREVVCLLEYYIIIHRNIPKHNEKKNRLQYTSTDKKYIFHVLK